MLLHTHLGELAALSAAMCWVFTSLAFAAAGRRIGPTAVNFLRIFLALGILAVIHRLLFGRWTPAVAPAGVVLLAASGLIGLTIGDQLLFTALVDVGPRMSTLLMTIAPGVAALLAWPVLDEPLGWTQAGGMALTLGGIAWVVLERPAAAAGAARTHPHRARGVVLAGLAGVCQAVGLVLSKLGMGHVPGAQQELVDPWTATLVRMIFAALGITVLVVGLRLWRPRRLDEMIEISPETEHLPPTLKRRDGRRLAFALLMVCVGATFGPVFGVWSSMVAVDRTETGIAATLMAMTPVFILPFAIWLERERVSWRAAAGALIAVAGVGILTALG